MVDARSTAGEQPAEAPAVRVLGDVALVHEGGTSSVPGSGRRAVLALLACHVGEPVHPDAIIAALWPEGEPRSAAKVVQTYVSQLRRMLADAGLGRDALLTTAAGYVLAIPRERCDAARFEDEAVVLMRAGASAAVAALDAVLAGWRGEPYAGVALPFAEEEAARLRALHARLELVRLERLVAEGMPEQALGRLEERAGAEPSDERTAAALIEALAALGRRGDALRAHERLRVALADELGVDPDPSIERRYLELLRAHDDVAAAPEARAADGAAPRPPSGAAGLPPDPAPLIGREAEVARVRDLLARRRLVTITGSGGAGKTRVALRVAHEESAGREVCWIPLAGLAEESRVAQHAMRALGLPEQIARPPLPVLIERLSRADTLVVLDNCEHVADGAARLVGVLLDACPGVAVLATSRTPLHAPGEQRWRLPALGLPAGASPDKVGECASGRLFVERARRVDPDFALTDDAARHVASICRALDGVPLALELAAARTGGLALRELDSRLSASLVLLTGGGAAMPRHRTLRAAIEWSHALLSEPQRRLLARLSVFASTFGADAVAAVCAQPGADDAETVATLADLVDASMVERTEDGAFRLLETVRQFAASGLGDEAPDLWTRHGAWVAASLEEVGAQLLFETARWYRRLDVLILEAQVAFDRALARGDAELGARIASGAGWSLINTGRYGLQCEWSERIMATGAVRSFAPDVGGHALLIFGATATIDGRHGIALARLDDALEAFARSSDATGALWVDYWRAAVLADLGRCGESVALSRDAAGRAGGHPEIEAALHAGLAEALAASAVDSAGEPRALLDEAARADAHARTLSRRAGLEEIAARVDMTDALLCAHRGDPATALERCAAELPRWRVLGRGNRLAVALIAAARVASDAGEAGRARELIAEGLETLDDLGWALPLGDAVEAAGAVTPDPAAAALLLGASSACTRTHRWHVPCDTARAQRLAHERLGPARVADLAAEGATLGFDALMSAARAAVA
ncbi:AfsR/SARP family transcriptional regulator [Demequina iriomotensis]|uniref:AfsR/SARP family transcriptional regulator n=1 Tax=Demequina iriomotensis TaxID=1536641 RepID=UPI000784F0DD|nr:BTAD domain-containing putative transcriptional regulator [Demequina iriomotensis]